MTPSFKTVSLALLSALAIQSCAPVISSSQSVSRNPRASLTAQNVAQKNLSQLSRGQAKQIIAESQQKTLLKTRSSTPEFKTPEWVRDAIFYQIFPERFYNGNTKNDPVGTEPWGSKPKLFNFMGGDLDGVIQKLPYLKEMGVNAIYFNPIFEAPTSNHKYDTANYMKVDPSFGDMKTFQALIKKAHSMGIRVLLDAVFNHSGDSHWAFKDAEKNGPNSKYWNWFLFHGFPVVKSPKPNYDSWWGFSSLPKFNEYNPEVRKHLLKVADFWTKQGIDGWRLDVPNEVRDMNFWREFRTHVKKINPDIYIVGEIWGDGSPWLQGDQFDAVMNYQFRDQVFNFLLKDKANVDQLDWGLEALRSRHPNSVNYSMFNVLGSHDTPRLLTLAKNDVNKVKLTALFQMTYVGAPVIYYGDEIGMKGEMDPGCRGAFPWNPAQHNKDLQNYYKRLIQIRNQYPALRRGSFRSLMRHNQNKTLAYLREAGQQKVMVVFNNNTKIQDVHLDAQRVNVPNGRLKDLMSGKIYQIQNGKVVFGKMPAKSGLVLELLK